MTFNQSLEEGVTVTSYGTVAPPAELSKEELDLLQSTRPGYGSRSIMEVALNIVNCTVGSGIIGLPYALLLSGFSLGVLISIFVSILTYFTVYTLILSGQKSQVFNFPALAERAMGKFGFHILNLMVFIQSAGSVLSYFILVGDTIPVLLGLYFPQYPILADRQIVTIVVSLVIIFPLNLYRSIGSLARWSAFSVFLLPVMIVSVLIRAPMYAPDHEAPILTVGKDPVSTFGTMSFAFVCSQVVFSNYLSQEKQQVSSWSITSFISTLISWGSSMTFAAIGYLSFGSDVSSNIFSNFPKDDPIINIGRFALGLSMVLTVPMGFYPARDAIQRTLGFESDERQPTSIQHYCVTFVLFVLLLVVGIHVDSLGKVYSFVGGVASSFLAYIIPGIIYITVFHPEWIPKMRSSSRSRESEPLIESTDLKVRIVSTWWLDIASVVLIVFGIMIVTLTIVRAF